MFKYYTNHNEKMQTKMYCLQLFYYLVFGFGTSKQIANALTLYITIWRIQLMFDLSYFAKTYPSIYSSGDKSAA